MPTLAEKDDSKMSQQAPDWTETKSDLQEMPNDPKTSSSRKAEKTQLPAKHSDSITLLFHRDSLPSTSFSGPMCRICHVPGKCPTVEICSPNTESSRLIVPCLCDGTLKYVHESCIHRWVAASQAKRCELCRFPFRLKFFYRPLRKWKLLPLARSERRWIYFSLSFHLLALICIGWSLFILIERATLELQNRQFKWSLWIKLVVIVTGAVSCTIFSYTQFRYYHYLSQRWLAFNRIFTIILPSSEQLNDVRAVRSNRTALLNSLAASNRVEEACLNASPQRTPENA